MFCCDNLNLIAYHVSICLLQVSSTRAPSDRSVTLMSYVAGVVREKYPHVLEFVNEVTYLEKAATGKNSLTSVCIYMYTVEPLNNGHGGDEHLVHCSEVVPLSEVYRNVWTVGRGQAVCPL